MKILKAIKTMMGTKFYMHHICKLAWELNVWDSGLAHMNT